MKNNEDEAAKKQLREIERLYMLLREVQLQAAKSDEMLEDP